MLPKRILEAIERRNIEQRKLAVVANINESSLSRYLNGYEHAKFDAVLRMVKFLFPDEELELMKEYVVEQKSRNARYALEYCVMNKLHDELHMLIDKLADSSNPVDREWAYLYELSERRRKQELPPEELLDKVELFNTKEIEMQVFKSILKGSIYFDLRENNALLLHIKTAEQRKPEIKSQFIRESFQARLGLMMSVVHLLVKNDVEKAREASHAILGQEWFDHIKGRAYYQLGYSYMLDDYFAANKFFLKAREEFQKQNNTQGIKELEYDISFLHAYWNIEYEHTLKTEGYNSLINTMFYYIKHGDTARAEGLLNQIDVENLSDQKKAFYWYYRGLLTNNMADYYRSVDYFVKISDHFHARLPVEELRKLGENEDGLKIFLRKGVSYEKTDIHS